MHLEVITDRSILKAVFRKIQSWWDSSPLPSPALNHSSHRRGPFSRHQDTKIIFKANTNAEVIHKFFFWCFYSLKVFPGKATKLRGSLFMNCFGQPWRQILFFIGREKKFIEFQKSWREGATNHPDKLALKTRGEGKKGSQSNEGFLNILWIVLSRVINAERTYHGQIGPLSLW